jgi:hypothetical protein
MLFNGGGGVPAEPVQPDDAGLELQRGGLADSRTRKALYDAADTPRWNASSPSLNIV